MPEPTTTVIDQLAVEIHPDEAAMGTAAAERAREVITAAVAERGRARVVIATGNSQYAFTDGLVRQELDWSRVTVFHLDEYVGIDADHPASFQRWIRARVEDRVHPGRVEYLSGLGDAEAEAARYEALLREAPLDLVCMGIGENGHLAFNEPFQTDFDDQRWVRVITLTEESRRQQVGEGHFPDLGAVPETAISLTVPALLSATRVQVCAPEARKAEAVRATLTDPVSTPCPATILRRTPHATLYLDPASVTSMSTSTEVP